MCAFSLVNWCMYIGRRGVVYLFCCMTLHVMVCFGLHLVWRTPSGGMVCFIGDTHVWWLLGGGMQFSRRAWRNCSYSACIPLGVYRRWALLWELPSFHVSLDVLHLNFHVLVFRYHHWDSVHWRICDSISWWFASMVWPDSFTTRSNSLCPCMDPGMVRSHLDAHRRAVVATVSSADAFPNSLLYYHML